jgi:hypothetical protein
MTFVHPLLLAGLAMVTIPILLHLLVRQKPKHLPFPALRFLLQRQSTNRRRMRLRHLVLLALRMLAIAGLCLALARPEVFSERLRLHTDRPVVAVLVFDTSYSMQYGVPEGTELRSRLDEAKRRGQELLAELPEGSRVAVLDTAHEGGGWAENRDTATSQIDALQLSHASGPVTDPVDYAYDLLAKLAEDRDANREPPPQFLYVFSDRTGPCWDTTRLRSLQDRRDRLAAPGVKAVFVDVGAEKPEDLAIVSLDLPRQVVPRDGEVEVRALLQATSRDYPKAVLSCRMDGQDDVESRPVSLHAGEKQEVVFTRRGKPGLHHLEVQLTKGAEPLAFTKVRFATFEVLGEDRQILVLSDDPTQALPWKWALEARGPYRCVVNEPQRPEAIRDEDAADLRARYRAICLLDVSRPSAALWEKLREYVDRGGSLAILPGGEELVTSTYNENKTAKELLPGRLENVVVKKDARGVAWAWRYEHALMKPFQGWNADPRVDWNQFPRSALRYWKVTPYPKNEHGETVEVVAYAGERQPAILERKLTEPGKAPGRVLLFTTALDARQPAWNNYVDVVTTFYVALAQVTMGYLIGDVQDGSFNHVIDGRELLVPLPLGSTDPQYTLCRSARPQGPGPSVEVLGTVRREGGQARLESNQVLAPGNYTLAGADRKPAACFSLNGPPTECQLTRVPIADIEALFGPGSVLTVAKDLKLREALQGPVNVLPWLLAVLALVLLLENLFANKFYRGDKGEPPAPVVAVKEEIPTVLPAEVGSR